MLSTTDASPDSAVNAGPYTDGVCRQVCPTSASSGSCGYCDRDVRVRARVVHREDASVDRVPPEVLGRAGRAGQSDDGLQRDRGADELDREAGRGAPVISAR